MKTFVTTSVALAMFLAGPTAVLMSADEIEIIKSDKLIDIGTHSLRVVLSDVAKSEYTIVLEAGGGVGSDSFKAVQDRLAESTGMRVISYDRSGWGKSELGPEKFNAGDEAAALKKCLELMGYEDKLVVAGLSYGGFLIQVFAHQYPELVSGMVLIDPMNVFFVDEFGLENLNAVTPYFENPVDDSQRAGNRMVDHFSESIRLIRGKLLPAGIPAILLTAGIFPLEPELWRDCHRKLVAGSENHRMVIAEGNHHDIVQENPDLVIETITELIDQIR
jgi:pimeloyl-ACP methyl ester carboxylesterase